MSFREFILDNYVMFFELIGLLIVIEASVHITSEMKKKTLAAVLLLFAETLFFVIERWSQTFDHYIVLRPMMTACLYSVYPLILIFLMQIIANRRLKKKLILFVMIPEIVSIPMYFSSQWTHLVCWFTESNSYAAGPLRLWPYFIFGIYTIVFLIQNGLYFRHYSKRIRLIAAYIVIGPIAGVLLYMMLNSDRDYSALFTSAIVLYYIFIYIHMSRIDPLTRLLNRQSFYRDLRVRTKSITCIVSADMNDLKYFNDNLGHEAGDEALKTVSAVMRDHSGRGGTVYRVGGDEFVIIYTNKREEDVVSAIAEMRARMAETPYVCAFGYAMKSRGDDLSEVVKLSDKRMYENKEELKKQKNPA